MTAQILTQSRLKEILHYCPDTGIFTWISRTANRIKIGSVAGHTSKSQKYVMIGIDGVVYRSHRLAWMYVHGNFPDEQIDHINHCRSDNRISNLRCVTNQENQKNRRFYMKGSSNHFGVSYNNQEKKWDSYINVDGKKKHIYQGDSLDVAIALRKDAEIEYGYHKNHGK